jgi:hypothetical protein
MRLVSRLAILTLCFGLAALVAPAEDRRDGPPPRGGDGKSFADELVARMMAFDKNKDGKLTRAEITDRRLLRLFDRADTNKDGVVTKEELIALAKEMAADAAALDPRRGGDGPPDGPPGPGDRRPGGPPDRRGPGGPDDRGPGDRGPGDRGPGDRGPGGPGGRGPGGFGRFGGPPQPGQILPGFLQERLNLTADQKKQLEALQKDIDAKLAKILTDEQKDQLKEMRERFGRFGRGGRGPGGFGPGGPGGRGPGGPGGRGPGGPGGPPPRDGDDRPPRPDRDRE